MGLFGVANTGCKHYLGEEMVHYVGPDIMVDVVDDSVIMITC